MYYKFEAIDKIQTHTFQNNLSIDEKPKVILIFKIQQYINSYSIITVKVIK